MALAHEKVKKTFYLWLWHSSVVLFLLFATLALISYKKRKHYHLLHALSFTQAGQHQTKTHKKSNKINLYQKRQQSLYELLLCLKDLIASNVRVTTCEYDYKKPLVLSLESYSLQGLMNTITLLSCHYHCTILELTDSKPFTLHCEINPLDHNYVH